MQGVRNEALLWDEDEVNRLLHKMIIRAYVIALDKVVTAVKARGIFP